MKKLILFFASAVFCLCFSGCTVFETDTEALMKPPVFTEEQEKLNAALTEVIGEDYVLKYPKTGEINSAFLFEDLDGDGTEEAMAFYSVLDEITRINVLKKDGEDWVSVYTAPGFYGEIKSADFINLDEKGKEGYIEISAKENDGIEKVKKAVSDIIGSTESTAFIANERQFEAVVRAYESIEKAIQTMEDGFFSDLAAIDIGNAIEFLGEAEGISINQETVDRIFEKFCLGK